MPLDCHSIVLETYLDIGTKNLVGGFAGSRTDKVTIIFVSPTHTMCVVDQHLVFTQVRCAFVVLLLLVIFFVETPQERDHYSQFVAEAFDSYVTRKEQDGVHGNNPEMQAASELFNRPIEVYVPESGGESGITNLLTNASGEAGHQSLSHVTRARTMR